MNTNPFKHFRIHHKNMPYRIHGVVRHSESLEDLQLYEALYQDPHEALWVRPLEMFHENIEEDGKLVPRFRRPDSLEDISLECFQKIKTPDFRSLQYLKSGSPMQRKIYEFLSRLEIFEILKDFHPLLAGTFPLGLEVQGSDLDILCETSSWDELEMCLDKADFDFRKTLVESENDGPACVYNIETPVPIEVFAQACPPEEQRAYLHLVAEARFLRVGGEEAFEQIRSLKAAGMKTEPAFAEYFGIRGDPYLSLLEYGKS